MSVNSANPERMKPVLGISKAGLFGISDSHATQGGVFSLILFYSELIMSVQIQ